MGHGGESGGGYVVGGGSDTTMAEAGDRADTERTRQTYERRREKDRDREGGRGTVKVLTFDKPPPPEPRQGHGHGLHRSQQPPRHCLLSSLSLLLATASSTPFTPPRLSQTIIRTIRNRRRLASRSWSFGLASSARGVKGHRENCRHRADTSVPLSLGISFLDLRFLLFSSLRNIRLCGFVRVI